MTVASFRWKQMPNEEREKGRADGVREKEGDREKKIESPNKPIRRQYQIYSSTYAILRKLGDLCFLDSSEEIS